MDNQNLSNQSMENQNVWNSNANETNMINPNPSNQNMETQNVWNQNMNNANMINPNSSNQNTGTPNKGNSNKTKNILIVFLILLIALLLGIIIYQNFIDSKNNLKNQESSNETSQETEEPEVTQTQVEVVTKEEVSKIIKDELSILEGKKSLSVLNNKDKLWFSFTKMLDTYGKKSDWPKQFKGSELTSLFEQTSLGHLGIKLEDIKYFAGETIYNYNSQTDTYKYIDGAGAYGVYNVISIYQKVGEGTQEGSRFTFPVKHLWIYNWPALEHFIFGKYEEALKFEDSEENEDFGKENSLDGKTHEIEKMSANELEKLVNDSRVETYYYVFEKVNGKINLVDYYKK